MPLVIYPWPRVRKYVFFIIYNIPKPSLLSTKISIPSNKEKKRARDRSTFIATRTYRTWLQNSNYTERNVQNVIILKQIFLILPQLFSSFSWVLLISFTHAFNTFENRLVFTVVWHFPWRINVYWKFLLFWRLLIPNQNKLLYSSLWKKA